MYLIEQHWLSVPAKSRYIRLWQGQVYGHAMFFDRRDAETAVDLIYATQTSSAFQGAKVVDES